MPNPLDFLNNPYPSTVSRGVNTSPNEDEYQTNLGQTQKRLYGLLTDIHPGDMNSYASQTEQIGNALRSNAGIAPTPYDIPLANDRGALASAGVMSDFYRNNPVPQMAQHDFSALPQRANVPIPVRGDPNNERAARLATAFTGLLGGQQSLAQVAPQLLQRGQYLDERDFGDTRQHYAEALQQANTQYGDALNDRNALLQWQQQHDQTGYANQTNAYNQGKTLAQTIGEQQGLTATTGDLGKLQSQGHDYAKGQADIAATQMGINEDRQHQKDLTEHFTAISNLYEQAANLYQKGEHNKADILLQQAEAMKANAMANSANADAQRTSALLPGQVQQQGAELNQTRAQTGLTNAKTAETPSIIKKNLSEAEEASARAQAAIGTASSLKEQAAMTRALNSGDQAATKRDLAEVTPYQKDVDAANKNLEDFSKKYEDFHIGAVKNSLSGDQYDSHNNFF